MQISAELVPIPDAFRMRPDASGCVGILISSKILHPKNSASTRSGSDPLQSEGVHSVVNSNFGAAQEVAQPAARLADQSFAQPETSSESPM